MSLEVSYAPRTDKKRELWSMKISPRLKYLAGLAARVKGKTLSSYVEATLEKSFEVIPITDEREANCGPDEPIHGKTLAELADSLYQGTGVGRFLALVKVAPWLVTDGESKLLRILQHSNYFAPAGSLHFGRITQHWETLAAIRDGEVDVDILPKDQRPSAALAFGLMGDAERIALYKSDPAKFKRESAGYAKAMKENK